MVVVVIVCGCRGDCGGGVESRDLLKRKLVMSVLVMTITMAKLKKQATNVGKAMTISRDSQSSLTAPSNSTKKHEVNLSGRNRQINGN